MFLILLKFPPKKFEVSIKMLPVMLLQAFRIPKLKLQFVSNFPQICSQCSWQKTQMSSLWIFFLWWCLHKWRPCWFDIHHNSLIFSVLKCWASNWLRKMWMKAKCFANDLISWFVTHKNDCMDHETLVVFSTAVEDKGYKTALYFMLYFL